MSTQTYEFRLPAAESSFAPGAVITVRALAPDVAALTDYKLEVISTGLRASGTMHTPTDELSAQTEDPEDHKIYQFLNVSLPNTSGSVLLKFFVTGESTPRTMRLIFVS